MKSNNQAKSNKKTEEAANIQINNFNLNSDSLFDQYYRNKLMNKDFNSVNRSISYIPPHYKINPNDTAAKSNPAIEPQVPALNNDDKRNEELDLLIQEYNNQLNQKNNLNEPQFKRGIINSYSQDYNNLKNNLKNNEIIKTPIPPVEEEPKLEMKSENIIPETEINPLQNPENIQLLIDDYNKKLELLHKLEAEQQQLTNPNTSLKKSNSLNQGIVLPKIQPRNYVIENKRLVTENKIPKKPQKIKSDANKINLHKDYGKTPKYLKEYIKEEERYKEMQRKKKELAKYPKGTRLVEEEERVQTIKDLQKAKEDILTMIERMPIARISLKTQQKKEELFKRLDEIEKGIEIFSRKKVFVQDK